MHRLACFVLTLAAGVAPSLAQEQRAPRAYQLAIGMQQRGLHDEAAEYLQRFLAEEPQHALRAEANYRLAQSCIELERIDDAIDALRAADQAGGRDFALRAETRYRLGNLLQSKGDHAGAVAAYQSLAKAIDTEHYLAAAQAYALGESLRELGKDADSVAAFAAAAERATGEQASFRFPACYQLGFGHLRLQQFDAAAVAFAAAADVGPDQAAKAECSYLVGDARLRLEQYDAAGRAFERTLELGGAFADDAAFGLGWVALGRGDRAAAIEAFGRLLRDHADSPFAGDARLERGRCLYQQQDYAAARAMLEPLLREGQPLQQQARELDGLCALASGAGKAAIASLQQAIAAAGASDEPRLWFALGEAYATQQQWQQALEAYGHVDAKAGPVLFGDARYGACHALHELGQHEASAEAAREVLGLEPPHPNARLAQLALAENLFSLQRYADAEPIYGELVGDREHVHGVRWKLAWCRYLQGDKDAAATRFAAIAADEQDTNREEALQMQALSLFELDRGDEALQVADRYRARFQDGRFLDRTERIAARVLRQRGELGAAQRRLQRAAAIAERRDDGDLAAADRVEQADLAYAAGDFEQAEQLFKTLTERKDALGVRALAGRAWCAFELGHDDVCLQQLARAKQHPQVAEELAGLLELESAVHHRRGAWPAAVTAAQTFLQQFGEHPKVANLRYALGVALARAERYSEARRVLAALAKAGGYAEADRVHYELAWACRRDGDEAAALVNFRKVAAQSQDVELAGEARLFVGTALLEAGAQARAEARRWLEAVESSHRPHALYRLGFAEFEAAGDGDGALLAAARDHFGALAAVADDELRGEALFLGGECCRRLGDPKGAIDRAQQLLEGLSGHERAPRARLLLGECALLAGAPDAAIAPLERFLRDHDAAVDAVARADAARANLWLGKARLKRRQHQPAEACFVRVTELSDGPLAAEAQYRLGESRADRNDDHGAADAFVKLPILYADATWVRRGLLAAGRVYDRMQMPAKAERFYRELRDKHQGSDEAKAAVAALKERRNR